MKNKKKLCKSPTNNLIFAVLSHHTKVKMTKSITITYSEADESLLMAFIKHLKVKIQETVTPVPYPDSAPTKQEFLAGLQESINEVKAAERGEIELQTLAELLAELEEEEAIYA
jgi:hypothetical protein